MQPMKPTLESLKNQCQDVDEQLITDHLGRLEDEYFKVFSFDQICSHLYGIAQISAKHPVTIVFNRQQGRHIDCTILAYDYPFEFSLITGILAATGYRIISGSIFTYSRMEPPPEKRPAGKSRKRIRINLRTVESAEEQSFSRRRIIDSFSGVLEGSESFSLWTIEVQSRMQEIFTLLEAQTAESLTRAKQRVNELVSASLSKLQIDSLATLYPMHIEVMEGDQRRTRMRVLTEDTPFFLFSFSTALSLKDISIERVKILTSHHRIEDEFAFVDSLNGNKLDTNRLNDVKLSLLLTKQFTYFLGKAPNPYNAIVRFERMLNDILKAPAQDRLIDLISNPRIMQDLAKLLGTSDFLWEDFIRLQYENLLPLLGPHLEGKSFSPPIETLSDRLERALLDASTLAEEKELLNRFKDNEIYLIDLDHILSPEYDFRKLSTRLTILAEEVIKKAVALTYRHLAKRYGTPRTVAGLEAKYSLLGLGKFGGQALGYASDIEFLLVYGDTGETGGTHRTRSAAATSGDVVTSGDIGTQGREKRKSVVIRNEEFFEYLVRDSVKMIEAKREGIFHIDLRLRPYGKNSPLACSLESFCNYYGQDGPAHSYERLAQVRLRAFGGDPALGAMIERLRDKMIYSSRSINLRELQDLREKQLSDKTQPGRLNAKFSPGALVDLEYAVQILQVQHGEEASQLRTPSIHKALDGLEDAGIIGTVEARDLVSAYHFLRKLINALRMLRGSARDLYLPPEDSPEFVHLARRSGYSGAEGIAPETDLYLDFETTTAAVRVFLERHFGRRSLPERTARNVADLILADQTPEEEYERILHTAGFSDPRKALINLRSLAGKSDRRSVFAKLAILACDILSRVADPDVALNNWERFVQSIEDPRTHFENLLSQHMRLRILLDIFSTSQFLSNTLIRNPEFFEWVTRPENLHSIRTEKAMETDLRSRSLSLTNHTAWLDGVRVFRRKEILRIGIKDLCLAKPTEETMTELSYLAEAVIRVVLERIWAQIEDELSFKVHDYSNSFCIMAFGKLGGRELNYSSDIDLAGLTVQALDQSEESGQKKETVTDRSRIYKRVMEQMHFDLTTHTSEGYAYRVDLRLRPYGKSGQLVQSRTALKAYYENQAELWEIQSLLKMRPVAGNLLIGEEFLESVKSVLSDRVSRGPLLASIRGLRSKASRNSTQLLIGDINIKNGPGGIRDIEFLVQGLQLIHAQKHPELICTNTLQALEKLARLKILPDKIADPLREDYLFLRKVEHYLQIWEDQQIHSLPRKESELNGFARRLMGTEGDSSQLLNMIKVSQDRIQKACEVYLYGPPQD